MYHFSRWKYSLVITVVVLGTLFALPNVFGTAPALQLSRNDRTAMDDAGRQRVVGVLEAQKVAPEVSYLEKDRLVLRFADQQQQTAARDAIIKGTSGDYLVALSDVPRTPEWMRRVGLKPMSLGLDLRGGVHFVYEVDIQSAVAQAIERMERDVRTSLRDKKIHYGAVSAKDGVVKVVLSNASDLQAAMDVLKAPDNSLVLTSGEGPDGTYIEMRMTPAEIKRRQGVAIEQNITTLRNRVDELGIAEPIVTRQAANRIVVQLPGVQDPNEAIRVLGATATLEFRLVDETNNPYEAESNKRIPIGSKLYKERNGRPILLKREIIATGEQLTDASSSFQEGQPQVNVKLDARGGQSMLNATKDNVGKRMAVVYIAKKQLAEGEQCKGVRNGSICTEEEVISAATIQSVLSSSFRITGLQANESRELALLLRSGALAATIQSVLSSSFRITGLQANESRELALLLRSGALAAPQTIVEQRSVGPTLGADNIKRGWHALAVGLGLTFAFMAVYYRGFGWIANAVLAANLVLTVGLLSLLQASLSLPGIAAVVFHLGIAVDANILIYERIREELRAGNSPLAAINAGFEKAFATIADSNVTTLIAGVVLFAFGTGTIRSFAIVMTLGILTSLFTSVVGSRALVHWIWGRRTRLAHLPI